MGESVLVHAYVYEGPERRDVRHYPGQPHALAQVVD